MHRRFIILALCVCALVSASVAAVTAHPADLRKGDPAAAPPPQRLIGLHGGKIIAMKPPGDWNQSGATGMRAFFSALLPAILPVFGTDVNVAASNETFMASDPANPLYFITGSNAVARSFSSNGGLTWTTTSPAGIGDPVGTYDNTGMAYFGQLSTGTCPDPVVVSHSTDGVTWSAQISALSDASPSDHFIDKPWMAADKTVGSPFYGRVYVSGTSFYAPGCNLGAYINNREVIAYSTNQGTTWSAPVAFSDASHDQDQFSNAVVANNGTLYVGYQYQNCTYNCTASLPMVQLVAKSTDGGVTFSPSMTITGPISPTGAFSGGYQYLYAGSTTTGFRHNDQAIIGVSPSNANQVYALWTDGRWDTSFVYQSITGQHADIAFSRSTDGGSTWAAPIKVNDTANGDGTDQFFPWMTVGSDGTIHASWMDRRAGGFPYREYYSQSTDGGLTWSANQAVADVSGTPSTFIGDYAGLAVNSDNTRVLPVWTDSRSGQRIYTDPGLLPLQGTPTVTATSIAATATPTVGGASATPTVTVCPAGPWAILSPLPTAVEGGFVDSDGTYAYVAGGYDGNVVTPNFTRYNPATGAWTVLSPMPTPADGTGVVYSPINNKLYVFGGADDPGNAMAVTRIYDLAAGTWTTGAPIPAPRQRFAGVGYYNGQIYVAGGRTTLSDTDAQPDTWRYDPVANTWTTRAALPIGVGGAGYGMVNGHLYVVSGVDTTGMPSTLVYDYNTTTNVWTTRVTSVPTGVNTPGSAVVAGRIWIFGGDDGTLSAGPARSRSTRQAPGVEVNLTQIYDPASNSWSSGPALNVSRSDLGGTSVGNVVLAVDGFTPAGVVDTTERTSVACGSPTPAASATATRTATSVSATSTATAVATVTACPIQFTDVLPADPFYSYIRCLACRNIISGYTTSPPCAAGATPCYNGGANVTRGQIAKIVANAAGYNDLIPSTQQTFTDVPYTNPFWVYIERLAEPSRGYISGYSTSPPCTTGTPCFLPFNNVTRGQMAKIDANAAGYTDAIPSNQQTFTDVPYTNPFWVYIERAALHGVISGYSTSPPCPGGVPCFLWANNLTRNQAAKVVAVTFYPNCQTPAR